MENVTITFKYKGEVYHGLFTEVAGGASSLGDLWFLMIDQKFKGQFHYSQTNVWKFSSNSGDFEDLTDYFEAYLTGWFE